MQQTFRRTPMQKCDFALRHGCSPVNLLYIFRTPFPRNTSRWLLLQFSARSLIMLLQTTVQFFSLLQCLVFICGYMKERFILFIILLSHFYIRYYERSYQFIKRQSCNHIETSQLICSAILASNELMFSQVTT